MDAMGDAIRRVGIRAPRFDPDPTDLFYVERRLLDLPPTTDVEAALAPLSAELATLDPEADAGPRGKLLATIQRLSGLLERAQMRDAMQAGRPEGCWCLGLGGRQRVYVRLLTLTGDGRDMDLEAVPSWREFCSCPAGEEARRQAQRIAAEAEIAEVAALQRRLWNGLPREFAEATFATWLERMPARSLPGARRLLATLTAWLDEPADQPMGQPWMYLFGPSGVGKTGLAVSLAKEATARGVATRFVVVPEFLASLRTAYSDEAATSETAILDDLKNVRLLILDDLGRHKGSDWATERLFLVVNHRYNARLRTVVTSNLTPDELSAKTDEFLATRILGNAKPYVLDTSRLPDLRADKRSAAPSRAAEAA